MAIPDFLPRGTVASSAISVDGVTRRFGRRWALRGISVEVAPGEVLGIEGHNGSGKSTLLRVVATAIRATSGPVRLFGRDIREHPDWARSQVALMGYTPGLYDDLTARENLVFAARMLGAGRDAAAVDDALERVGLLGEAGEQVRTFSSGMQRRLALGRLLLQRPGVLLLDEPYNSLDKDGVALVNEVVREVTARAPGSGTPGAAMIVLHDRRSAVGVLDRVVTMHQGRLADHAVRASEPEPPPAEWLANKGHA